MNSALRSDLASGPIDESITELDTRSKHASASANRTYAVGPFGVLDFSGTQQPAEALATTPPQQRLETNDLPVDVPDTTSPDTDLSLESLNNIDNFLDWQDLFQLDFVSPDFAMDDVYYPPPEESLELEASYRSGQRTYPQQASTNQIYDQESHNLPLLTNSAAPETSLRDISPSYAQTLLKHFNDQVIAHFSPLPPDEKAHGTILNVQSAILTLANITYIQTSCVSHAAMANLMALSAISAHHLAHQNDPHQAQIAPCWRRIGDSAIRQAKEHLQHSLKNEVQGPNRAKYKDQVMAISAMLAFSVRAYLVVISFNDPDDI